MLSSMPLDDMPALSSHNERTTTCIAYMEVSSHVVRPA